MRGLDIHKNVPVSVTKLTLGVRVGFISFHLTADKLFPVNTRAITQLTSYHLLLLFFILYYSCCSHAQIWRKYPFVNCWCLVEQEMKYFSCTKINLLNVKRKRLFLFLMLTYTRAGVRIRQKIGKTKDYWEENTQCRNIGNTGDSTQSVWGKHSCTSWTISYCHTEWYPFPRGMYHCRSFSSNKYQTLM